MKIKGNFKAWFGDGKYYLKKGVFSRKKEISKEEYKSIAQANKITEASVTTSKVSLSDLYREMQRNIEEGKSEFGRRVNVNIVKSKQIKSKSGEGLDVMVKIEVVNEDTGVMDSDMFYQTIEYKSLTGPIAESGISVPEFVRSLHQALYNGALHNQDEVKKLDDLLDIAINRTK